MLDLGVNMLTSIPAGQPCLHVCQAVIWLTHYTARGLPVPVCSIPSGGAVLSMLAELEGGLRSIPMRVMLSCKASTSFLVMFFTSSVKSSCSHAAACFKKVQAMRQI